MLTTGSLSAAHRDVSRVFVITVRILLVMILTLMALGAGVRAMNAGLSCPDWPLCFGKVIPDFHPGVYFEFIHRAYAGIVALTFFACCAYVFKSDAVPRMAKRFAGAGIVVLLAQIVMGGLTVLKLIKDYIVTSHLMLATLFFSAVLWMSFLVRPSLENGKAAAPRWLKWLSAALAAAVLGQILIGGLVASTYAGSVCVDWPRCNGQWFPTWMGAIGLQILHRMVAYALVVVITLWAVLLRRNRNKPWMTGQLLRLGYLNVGVVSAQVALGVANLLLYIPPHVTVLHQSVGIVLFAVNLRTFFVSRELVGAKALALTPVEAHAPEPRRRMSGTYA